MQFMKLQNYFGRKGGEVGMKDEPNKITATLKVVITGEFYGDEASEETLRYCVEQDLEDAGFDVDVSLLKEQEAKTGHWIQSNPKFVSAKATGGSRMSTCSNCGKWGRKSFAFCPHCGAKMEGR